MLWFEITKMLIAVLTNKFILLFITIFGTLSLPVEAHDPVYGRVACTICIG